MDGMSTVDTGVVVLLLNTVHFLRGTQAEGRRMKTKEGNARIFLGMPMVQGMMRRRKQRLRLRRWGKRKRRKKGEINRSAVEVLERGHKIVVT